MGRVIGYDLTDLFCQVSIGIDNDGNEEVRSVPVLAGTERYVIPVAAYIGPDDEIAYGEDAIRLSGEGGELIRNLLVGAPGS